jgi:hypothetical protein
MHARPYTAVLIESKTFITRVMNISAPLRWSDAKSEVEKKHSDCKLVALVPGHHADGSHSFELHETLRPTTDRFVDPFDSAGTS